MASLRCSSKRKYETVWIHKEHSIKFIGLLTLSTCKTRFFLATVFSRFCSTSSSSSSFFTIVWCRHHWNQSIPHTDRLYENELWCSLLGQIDNQMINSLKVRNPTEKKDVVFEVSKHSPSSARSHQTLTWWCDAMRGSVAFYLNFSGISFTFLVVIVVVVYIFISHSIISDLLFSVLVFWFYFFFAKREEQNNR